MAFRPVDARQSFPELEEQILERWRERDVFQRSLAQRADAEVWSFYEGPPTANGEPGSHHVLSRVFKDIYPRYRTMRGYRVPRKAGWDCHGLPVELAVEKELDIASKAEIEAYGIAEFNERCRESVFRYVEQWGRLTERVGFWIDLDDAYVTLANSYIESVWWSLRKVWDEGRLYQAQQGGAVLPARRDGALLARGGPGIPRRRGPLRLREAARAGCGVPARAGDALLVWTTTPWTLITNAAVAVGPEIEYARVRIADEVLIVAAPLVERVLGEGAEVLDALPRLGAGRIAVRPALRLHHRLRAAGPHGPRGRLRHHRRGDRPRPHGDRLRRGRLPPRRAIRDQAPEPGEAGRNVRRADHRLRGALRQGGRQRHRRSPAAARQAASGRDLRALLPALLALRHAPPLLREVELVHPHHRRPRPDARRERDHRMAPGAHQARALRQVARGKRRLGPLPRALLGNAAAHLGVRAGRLQGAVLRRVVR